jgi:hypothetical protein
MQEINSCLPDNVPTYMKRKWQETWNQVSKKWRAKYKHILEKLKNVSVSDLKCFSRFLKHARISVLQKYVKFFSFSL